MTIKDTCDSEHVFVLVLSGVTEIGPSVLDAIFEAGCDDSTPSIRSGRVYLTFQRTAPTIKDAVLSAIRDIKRANIGAEVLRVDDCNHVSQADIARRINRSRQQVGQYVSGNRGPGNFPAPVCGLTEGPPLWMWCEVSFWLWQNGIIGEAVLDASRVVAGINSALDFLHQQRLDPSLLEEVLRISK